MTDPHISIVDGAAGRRLLLSAFIRSRHPQAMIEEIDPFAQTALRVGRAFAATAVISTQTDNRQVPRAIVLGGIGSIRDAQDMLTRLFSQSSQQDCPPVVLLASPDLQSSRDFLKGAGAFEVLRNDALSFNHFYEVLTAALNRSTLPAVGDHVGKKTHMRTTTYGQYGQFSFVSSGARHALAIEGYRNLGALSTGKLAEVFFAEHIESGKRAVVKIQTAAPLHEVQRLLHLCKRAILISQYRSPHLVQAIDSGIADNYAYVVLEYLAAGDLRRALQSTRDIASRVQLAMHTLMALDALHSTGYVHCDLKPESIFFRADGSVVLIDFNISTPAGEAVVTSQTGDVMGTPTYMSPEQGAGMPVTAASDLYALGIVLFEMLSGTPPFSADTPAQTLYRHIHDEVPLLPKSTRHFQEVVDHLLEKNAAMRPDSAKAAHALLQKALSHYQPVETTLDSRDIDKDIA
jgi:Protein kinase domain